MPEELLPLTTVLRARREANLVTDAKIVAEYPDCPDRSEHAQFLIRETMHLRALGRIGHETQYRIFSILAFAMPEPEGYFPHS